MVNQTTKLSRRQLSDEAASHVRALIVSGALSPGKSVRPEAIAAELGVSTTPAREALQQLRAEGFLELSPGRGFAIAPLTGKDIRDLFAVQGLIAGELAARAALVVDPSTLTALDDIHDKLNRAAALEDTELLERWNHEFHRTINLAADARKVTWVLGVVTKYVPREFYGTIEGWPEATVNDHSEILAALHDHDPDRARAAVRSHIEKAGALLATHFDHSSEL